MSADDSETPPLVLMQYGSAWGAPSLAVECTKAQAWLRFCGLELGRDVILDECNAAQAGWASLLPVLRSKSAMFERAELYAHLQECGHDPDAGLSAEQKADSAAFAAFVEERLGVALLYSWWADADNYAAVIRPAYADRLPLPLCFYLPWTERRRALSQLARRNSMDPEVAYKVGEEVIRAVAVRLGSRPFFHGAAPTSVDASLFAYLSAVLRCPLVEGHDRLRRCLREHPTLERYCTAISERYFGGSPPLLPASASETSREGALQPAGSAATWTLPSSLYSTQLPTVTGSESRGSRTPKQQRFRTRSQNAVLAAAGSALAYAFASDMFSGAKDDGDDDDDSQ